MTDTRPRIVFVTLSNDIGSERIVSEMSRRGAACAVLGRPGSFASLCRGVHNINLPSRGGAWVAAMAVPRRLERLAAEWRPDAIVPIDDLAAQSLRDLATARRTSPQLRALLAASLGDPAHYRTVCSRSRLMALAANLGIRTPGQHAVASLPAANAAAGALGYPVLLKREQTCGGCGVTLVEKSEDMRVAFRSADRKAKAKRLARLLLGLVAPSDSSITLQAFVRGTLALRSVACSGGRVLAGVTFAAERLDPPTMGSSTVIRQIDNSEIDDAVRVLTAALGCSGFLSFDFLVSPDGSASLIEMNARPVGSGHLGARFGCDLYGRWLAPLIGSPVGPFERPRSDSTRPIALFPKEMLRDPASASLSRGVTQLHDIPWDEPDVLAAYRDRLVRRYPDQVDLIDRTLSPDVGGFLWQEAEPPFGAEALAGL